MAKSTRIKTTDGNENPIENDQEKVVPTGEQDIKVPTNKKENLNNELDWEKVKTLIQQASDNAVFDLEKKRKETPQSNPPAQSPTPGRIVTYFPELSDALSSSGKAWPAVITEVEENTISLQVFGKYNVVAKQNVPNKNDKKKDSEDGSWDWPARS